MSITATVDYNLSLEQMIAVGNYDRSNRNITAKRFPLKGIGKVELEPKLFYFGRKMSSNDVIAEIEKEGFRPCTIEELLAIGEQHPELQREFPLVELGSLAEVDGLRRVAYLSRGYLKRGLSLGWFDCEWTGVFRFPSVRK